MNIVAVAGNHPRHLFFLNAVHAKHPLAGSILQIREHMVPTPPSGIDERDRQNFIKHFHNRDEAEKKYFGSQSAPECERLEVSAEELNGSKSAAFIRKTQPDVVLIFGTDLIKGDFYHSLPPNTVNMHLGLSPKYRGAATLFWPFYFLEPQFAGSTFHHIIAEPDAGDVIHQTRPELEKGDHIHDVACKTVVQSAKDAVKLLELYEATGQWQSYRQKASGKNFLVSDFSPEHLRVIYDLYQDNIVDCYLDGQLKSKEPKLIRQFP